MKKNLISESEVKEILSMHKSLKEQDNQKASVDLTSDLVNLRKAITAGCLKGGKLLSNANQTKYVYRATTKSGKIVDFTADMNYKFTDGSKSGKWKCDEITQMEQNQSDSDAVLKEKKEKEGWMEYSELVGKGYSQLEADQGKYDTIQFKLRNGKTIPLYKPKVGVMSGQQKAMTAEQQAFISKWISKGGKLTLTPEDQATQRFKKIKIPGSDVAGWKDGLEMWFDIDTIKDIAGKGEELKSTVEKQVIPLDECKTFVDQFFKAYQDDSDIPDFDILKRQVKRCKSLYSPNERTGRKSGWGMLTNQKNKIDILSGLVSGKGPSTYGTDSKWRLE